MLWDWPGGCDRPAGVRLCVPALASEGRFGCGWPEACMCRILCILPAPIGPPASPRLLCRNSQGSSRPLSLPKHLRGGRSRYSLPGVGPRWTGLDITPPLGGGASAVFLHVHIRRHHRSADCSEHHLPSLSLGIVEKPIFLPLADLVSGIGPSLTGPPRQAATKHQCPHHARNRSEPRPKTSHENRRARVVLAWPMSPVSSLHMFRGGYPRNLFSAIKTHHLYKRP
jgi:hypothetical protein